MSDKPWMIIADNRGERMAICKQCPYISENKKTCTKCGCLVKLKCTYKLSKCPDNRWNNGTID